MISRAVLAALLLVAPAVLAGDRVKEGSWEATMVTDGESRVLTFCLTGEQAAGLNGDSKTGREAAAKKAGARCNVKSYEASGDLVSYTLVCGTHTISDVTHYHGDTSEGVKTSSGDGATVVTKVKSKRLGPCP